MSFWSETGGTISSKFKEVFGKIFYERQRQIWEKTLVPAYITYPAQNTGDIDIRKVFNVTAEGENLLNKTLFDIDKNILSLDEDRKVKLIRDYVNDIIIYVSDRENYGGTEYWADPITILNRKKDDCDGFAVLMAKLMWMAGVRRNNLKLQALDVYDDDGNAAGGHANLIYLDDYDNEWYTIEGSYWSGRAIVNWAKNIPQRENKMYGTIWWVTDDLQSYATSGRLVIKEGFGGN